MLNSIVNIKVFLNRAFVLKTIAMLVDMMFIHDNGPNDAHHLINNMFLLMLLIKMMQTLWS